MLRLHAHTELLAHRLAEAKGLPVADAVHEAVEGSIEKTGLPARRRRLTAEQMLAVGAEIAALPLLDSRSPQEIMDDLNTA